MIIKEHYELVNFYFKVKASKLDNVKLLEQQLEKVYSKIEKKYNVLKETFDIQIGTVDDDFVNNIFRLKISLVNVKK